MAPTKVDKLTTISLSVFRLNGQLIEWGNNLSKPHGLTSARWQVLGAISMAGKYPTVPQIAAAVGVTRQGVLKQINLLVDEGLVYSQPNPSHKRSPLYAMTGKGKVAYERLIECWLQHVQKIESAFAMSDLDSTIQVLSKMSQIHSDY